MIQLRKSQDRGHFDHGWLKTQHSFSFASYYDPQFMGYRDLRVINQDVIAPGKGFGAHPHNDMEIITYILRGTLEHQDSMGNREQIAKGELQVMSAGTGIVHSEYNPSSDQELELLQIWVLPKEKHVAPRYEQMKIFEGSEEPLRLIVAPEAQENVLMIHQDVKIFAGKMKPEQKVEYLLGQNRGGWVQLISGELHVNEAVLQPGDGLAIESVEKLQFEAKAASEFIFFDLV